MGCINCKEESLHIDKKIIHEVYQSRNVNGNNKPSQPKKSLFKRIKEGFHNKVERLREGVYNVVLYVKAKED